MSAADKTKLDGIETGANKTIVDTALSSASTNPVQNKVINTALSTTNTNVSTNTTNITTLKGYFTNGAADKAIGDKDGKDITTTYATKTELGTKANASDFNLFKNSKGQPNGLAELDSAGKVPSSQLPSYVDDVIEGYYYNSKFYKEESHTTEITGESGKIYTDLGNNKTYRWSGTTYTEISASLALGETSSTAYPGDKGKANAANIANNTTNITTLKGYFNSNGVANKAAADGKGNNIVDTYATKSALSTTNSNVSTNASNITTLKGYFNSGGVANKAAADENGNNIVDTYATRSALSTTNSNVSTNTSNITTLKGYFKNGASEKAIADEDGNPIKTSYVKISETDATTKISSYIKNLGNEIQLYLAKALTKYTEVDLSQTGIFITIGNSAYNFESSGDFYYTNIDDDNVYLYLNQKNHTPITDAEINAICQ